MDDREEWRRKRAIARFQQGEKPESIFATLGRTERWFYKWLKRYQEGDAEWYRERSRKPEQIPHRTSDDLEATVTRVRKELCDAKEFCGAQAIRWRLEDEQVAPLPSVRTINRILSRHGLIERRNGRYEPKGKQYPALDAPHPGSVHQCDLVGPCYLRTPRRFYSFNTVDLATGRCGVEPILDGKAMVTQAIWTTWLRLGIPQYLQFDNEATFYGSPAHPRGLGRPIRLCLLHGVQPYFIPVAEPWRNGVVEKFNDHWRQKFFTRVPMESTDDLVRESLKFEQRHNAHYRYSKLRGRTPLQALADANKPLRFPEEDTPPASSLPRPETGFYHVVRFIRSDGRFSLFGEMFAMPPESIYEYVWATVDVARQRVSFFLDGEVIDEREYLMR